MENSKVVSFLSPSITLIPTKTEVKVTSQNDLLQVSSPRTTPIDKQCEESRNSITSTIHALSASQGEITLDWLPNETLLHILSFLTPIQLLKCICLLGKRWNQLALDDSLWKFHVMQHPNFALTVTLQQTDFNDKFAADGKPHDIESWVCWYRELFTLSGNYYRAVDSIRSSITGQLRCQQGELIQVVGTQPRAGWVYARKGRQTGFIETGYLEDQCTIVTNSSSLSEILNLPLIRDDTMKKRRNRLNVI